MARHYFIFFFLLLFQFSIYSQGIYPHNYFDSPIKNNFLLVGNFGEIRANHLHSGFDIRTNNAEGMPVMAVADGYVSRIKISALGYGKALYITHPNGYTSVYGHLQSFEKAIETYSKQIQYANELFEFDTILQPSLLSVKKGQLIGLSGNTGSSSGPHLHFEIRETKSEMPVNPFEFGYSVADNTKPIITELVLYPIDENSTINGRREVKKMKPIYNNNKYTMATTDTLNVNGDIGFGISCYDTENDSRNKNGVFSIELLSGGKRIFYYEMEKFSFENSRYVNAHIDYAELKKNKEVIQKCFLSKNNKLEIYKGIINNGIISFKDDSVHWIKFIVKDVVGNSSEIMLKIKSSAKAKSIVSNKDTCNLFHCLEVNKFTKDDIDITIPAMALYDDVCFNYSKTMNVRAPFAPLHHIENDGIGLQKGYLLKIKGSRIPDSLADKTCIVSIDKKGKINYEGGVYQEGWVMGEQTTFGDFTIGIDKMAPMVKPNFIIANNKVDLTKVKAMEFRAMDNLSGIKKYTIKVDGKWVLCEFEPKKNLLFYTFDDHVGKGNHGCEIRVSDDKNNVSVLKFEFLR